MDLSDLVTIGLFSAEGKPLSGSELEYFQQHGLEQALADIVDNLARQKPADPYRFIAERAAGLAATEAVAALAAALPKPPAAAPSAKAGDAEVQIKALGDQIRELKERLRAQGLKGKELSEHEEIKALVQSLQELKAQSSTDALAPAASTGPAPVAAPAKAQEKEKKPHAGKNQEKKPDAPTTMAKQPAKGGGLDVRKAEDVPGWYEQVMTKGELIEQYPIKGCFILRPWAYRLWELIQGWFDERIKGLGVENCYFPMFIPKCYMEKESDHLEDFAPELAMVTKFGNTDLDEPVAIRPTSETAMYAAYANWVQSHRDLPVRLNQWCNVVRWEVKQTTPFLRTREFLWQEGHTAYAERAGAEKEVLQILELYAGVYEQLLAVPVLRGTKTKAETFPGADYTTTVEAFIPATGRAIQGATSHHLGQNFSKMFDICFQDPSDPSGKAKEYAYQNSWGLTTRTLGVMVMVHGDDKGLVLPPKVAGFQVVIVPVGLKVGSTDQERSKLAEATAQYHAKLAEAGIRAKLDDGDQTPGWKFNYWEMKGVPLRIELGPLDIKKGEFVMAKRHILDQKAAKSTGKDATLVDDVRKALDGIQADLYEKALAERDARLAFVDEWKDFSPHLNKGMLILVPFCGKKACEEAIKEKSKEEAAGVEVAGGLKMGAKSLCVPHEDKYNKACPSKCIFPDCECSSVTRRTLFGRSY